MAASRPRQSRTRARPQNKPRRVYNRRVRSECPILCSTERCAPESVRSRPEALRPGHEVLPEAARPRQRSQEIHIHTCLPAEETPTGAELYSTGMAGQTEGGHGAD